MVGSSTTAANQSFILFISAINKRLSVGSTDDAKIELNCLTFIHYLDKYQYFVCES